MFGSFSGYLLHKIEGQSSNRQHSHKAQACCVLFCNSSTGVPREREASEVLLLSLILLLLFDFNKANALCQGTKMENGSTGH